MAIYGDYSIIEIDAGHANDREVSLIVLSAGDVTGRTIRYVMRDGTQDKDATGLTARLYIDQDDGLYCDMAAVSGADTATFEVAVPMGNVNPGYHRACIRVTDSGGNVINSRLFTIFVEKSLSESGSPAMLEVLDALRTATADARAAADSANAAASSATSAVETAVSTLVPQAVSDELDDLASEYATEIPDSAVIQMVGEEW